MTLFLRIALRSVLLWFGLIWLLVGAVVGGVGLHMLAVEQTFQRESVTVQGTVKSKVIRPANHSDHTRTAYVIVYSFPADAGSSEGRAEVSVEKWESLVEGAPLPVRYVPDEPLNVRLENKSDPSPLIMAMIGLAFGGVGGGIAFHSLRRCYRECRLRQEGTLAQATVTRTQATNFRLNEVTQWEIHYRYRDASGMEQEGKSGYMQPADAHAWKAGATAFVRFDALHPEQSVWIGASPADTPAPLIDAEAVSLGSLWRALSKAWNVVWNVVKVLTLAFAALVIVELPAPLWIRLLAGAVLAYVAWRVLRGWRKN